MHRHDVLYLLGAALVSLLVYWGGTAGLYTESGLFIALLASPFPATMSLLIAMFREADIEASRHMGRAWLGAALLWLMVAAISYDTFTAPRAAVLAIGLYVLVISLLLRRKRLRDLTPA